MQRAKKANQQPAHTGLETFVTVRSLT